MPYREPDATDPMTLHGVEMEVEEDVDRDMAAAFIEEFLRMGYSRDRVLALFYMPKYAGPYRAMQRLGEAAIERMVDERAALWGGRRAGGSPRRDDHGDVLPG